MKYIVIMEDGGVYKTNVITDDDKNACDDGILSVIDTDAMKTYYETEWHDLELWGEE